MRVKVKVERGAPAFLLEDSPERIKWFQERIPGIVVASTADEAIAILSTQVFDYVFLDHDLGLLDYAGQYGPVGNGQQVARYLSGRGFIGKNVFIHSWNPMGAARMKDLLENAFAVPFGQFEIDCN